MKNAWTDACTIAMKACGKVGDHVILPRFIHTHQIDSINVMDLQGAHAYYLDY
jgi:hypothetical protein